MAIDKKGGYSGSRSAADIAPPTSIPIYTTNRVCDLCGALVFDGHVVPTGLNGWQMHKTWHEVTEQISSDLHDRVAMLERDVIYG